MAQTSAEPSDFCMAFGALCAFMIFGVAGYAVLWPFVIFLPSIFRCNEIVRGSVVSISHLPTPSLQPPLCDVHVQAQGWKDTISSIPCTSVARCEVNLADCASVEFSVNHYNRERCIGPRDKLGWFTLHYTSVDWWWQYGGQALLLLLAIALGFILREWCASSSSDAVKPGSPPAASGGTIDPELALKKAKGPGV